MYLPFKRGTIVKMARAYRFLEILKERKLSTGYHEQLFEDIMTDLWLDEGNVLKFKAIEKNIRHRYSKNKETLQDLECMVGLHLLALNYSKKNDSVFGHLHNDLIRNMSHCESEIKTKLLGMTLEEYNAYVDEQKENLMTLEDAIERDLAFEYKKIGMTGYMSFGGKFKEL